MFKIITIAEGKFTYKQTDAEGNTIGDTSKNPVFATEAEAQDAIDELSANPSATLNQPAPTTTSADPVIKQYKVVAPEGIMTNDEITHAFESTVEFATEAEAQAFFDAGAVVEIVA